MRKYWVRFLSAIATEFQYRANLIWWMIVGAISPVVMTLIWFAILQDRPEIGGYDRGDFVLYYLLTTVGWYIVGGEFARPIGEAIKSGDINKSLLQPYNVVLGKAVWEQAWKVLSLVISIPVSGFIMYFNREYISLNFEFSQLPTIVLSLVGGALIFGLLQAIIGILAFWVTEIWPFAEMNDMLLQLMGGMLAPISLLPPVAQQISMYLPFRYVFFEPVAIVLSKTAEPYEVIARQYVFVILLYLIYKIMWREGIKRYEAIGG